MNNKKGFTLVEIILVIAILGILAILTVPAVLDILSGSKEKAMVSQENALVDSAKQFLNDFCRYPITSSYKKYCKISDGGGSLTEIEPIVRKKTVKGKDYYYICVSDLAQLEYVTSSTVKYDNFTCEGVVLLDREEEYKYDINKTYFICPKPVEGGGNSAYMSNGADAETIKNILLDSGCSGDRGSDAYEKLSKEKN